MEAFVLLTALVLSLGAPPAGEGSNCNTRRGNSSLAGALALDDAGFAAFSLPAVVTTAACAGACTGSGASTGTGTDDDSSALASTGTAIFSSGLASGEGAVTGTGNGARGSCLIMGMGALKGML